MSLTQSKYIPVYTSSIDYIKPGLLQAFLEPYFAPGILYNSIKS